RRGRRRAAAEPTFSPFTSVPPHRREGYLIDALLLGLGEFGMRSVAELCGTVRPFLTPEWCAAEFRVAARMDPRAAAACATDEARAALGLRTLVEWTLRGLEGQGLLPVSWDDPEPQVILGFNVPSRLLRRFTELKKCRSRAHDAAEVLLANKERRTVGKLRTAMRAALKRLWHKEARELVIAHVLLQLTQSARYATEKTNGRLVFWLRAPSGSTEAGGEGVPNGGAPAGATATPAAAISSPNASEPSTLTFIWSLPMTNKPRSPL